MKYTMIDANEEKTVEELETEEVAHVVEDSPEDGDENDEEAEEEDEDDEDEVRTIRITAKIKMGNDSKLGAIRTAIESSFEELYDIREVLELDVDEV